MLHGLSVDLDKVKGSLAHLPWEAPPLPPRLPSPPTLMSLPSFRKGLEGGFLGPLCARMGPGQSDASPRPPMWYTHWKARG